MSNRSVQAFISTVIQHFPPFRWDEEQEKAWVSTMAKELAGFSPQVLDKAVADMVRTRKDRKIPLVAECINACLETRRWLDKETASSTLPIEPATSIRDWTAERLKLANDLVMGPLGKQAAKEGWIGMLWAYARKNQKLPTASSEIEALKREAKAVDQLYSKAVKGDLLFAPVLEKWGANVLKKRNELADMVLHGVTK